MVKWPLLASLSNEELARRDIIETNLECAVGLPGCDGLDTARCIRLVDRWADACRQFINDVMPQFHSGRCDYPDSKERFQIQAMITHLQRDLGIRYRFDKRDPSTKMEPCDSFVVGIFHGLGGMCGTLPVLYAAVGRRLGYPLRLATTRRHMYLRWEPDDGSEAFNIEASGDGVSFYPDDYFHSGPFEMPPETVVACGFCKSLTPREVLAGFLTQRGNCWREERVYVEAVQSYIWANELDPTSVQYLMLTHEAMLLWHNQLQEMLPPRHFPNLDIGLPGPGFKHLPRQYERELIRLQIMEALLNNKELEERWWTPARNNPSVCPKGCPAQLTANYDWIRGINILLPRK